MTVVVYIVMQMSLKHVRSVKLDGEYTLLLIDVVSTDEELSIKISFKISTTVMSTCLITNNNNI